jgi:hypothetical protein
VDFRVDSSNSAFGKKERVFGLGRRIAQDENGRGSFVGRGKTPDLGLFTLFTNPIY